MRYVVWYDESDDGDGDADKEFSSYKKALAFAKKKQGCNVAIDHFNEKDELVNSEVFPNC